MTLPISISPAVGSQILAFSAFLESDREGLGQEFDDEFASLLGNIRNNPAMYPRVFGTVRKALVRRFTQHVYYAVEKERIVILELRDARREPPDWKALGYQAN